MAESSADLLAHYLVVQLDMKWVIYRSSCFPLWDTHCCRSVSTKGFRRIQTAEVVDDEQVLYVASNCQLLQESQLEAPGPEKSPLAQAVHTLAPAEL